eukprot:gene8776-9714_t
MLSEVTWENEMGDMNVDESWSFFRDKVITAIKDYVPLSVPKKPNAKPPYWNKSLTRHVRKKYNLFKRWERTGRESHYKEYAKQRNMTSKVLRKNERLYERSLAKEFKEKPKHFYGYVRNKMKTKANVPQLQRSDGSMTESDQQKADVLNEFFQSVFVEENTSKLPDFDIRTDNIIEDVEFTVEDVKKKLDQLKEDKAAAPDCIPPKVLKELRNVLALPLYLIFRKSLDESYLPSEWKTANITSIFKKGSKKSPGNYRPISLTSVACKIMESIIRDAAVEHSNKDDLFCRKTVDNQVNYTMTNNGERTQIERSKCEKDVGVWISDDLKPSTQCSKAAAKASSSLGFIKRAFKHIDKDSFVILYNSYVRPHMEYCVQAWSPYYVKDIDCLEKIQRRATKLVKHIRKWTYEQRLSYLGLYSLKCRRERGDLIETFKILNDFEGINSGQFFKLSTEARTRGNSFKLYKTHAKRLNISRTQRGVLKSSGSLNWDSFVILFNSLVNPPEVHDIYKSYLKSFPDLGLTPQEFMEFLEIEQKERNVTIKACVDLIEYHDKAHVFYKRICARGDPNAFQNSRRLLSYHGFLSFLRSTDNSVYDFNHTNVYQDMDQPLSDYYINSSHNTYLTGHQLKGLSSCEAYVRVLQQGSRCLEIDCWDGPDEPMVTHGLTLTTKIKFRDVITTIKEYAFETNPYPIILSLENHCSKEQQRLMANMFVTEFNELLALEDLSENNTLPSPNRLLKKIILKGRPKTRKKAKILKVEGKKTSITSSGGFRSWSQTSVLSNISEASESSLMPKLSTDTTTSPFGSTCEDTVSLNADDQIQVPLAASMGRLIVYCRAIPFKKNEFNENCCEMHSLSENLFTELLERNPKDLTYMSRNKLLRTYPKGSRVESSNFNPMPMWKFGIQMASVNFQKPDFGMHINQGFFRNNGGCGYVLKPSSLRRTRTMDLLKIMEKSKSSKMLIVNIKVHSGQFVDTHLIGDSPLALEIEAVGSGAKNNSILTEAVPNHCNPKWKDAQCNFAISQPELCVIYFKLFSVNRTSKIVLQNVIPVCSIKQGLRYIPLKTLTGVALNQNGLFVSIGIESCQDHRNLHESPTKDRSKAKKRQATY